MSQTPEEKDLLTPETEAAPEVTEEAPKDKTVAYDESLFEGSTVFSKPKEEPKKARLKPAVKGAIAAAIVLVIALGVGLPLILTAGDSNGTSSVPSGMLAPVYTVTDVNEADLTEAVVYNANGSMRFLPTVEEATSSDDEASVLWQVEGYEKYDLTGAATLMKAAVHVTTENRSDAKEGQPLADDYVDRLDTLRYGAEASENDESVYGFDRPFAAICMTDSDGGKTAFLIGDFAPDGSGRYVTATGRDGVYIINESSFATGRYGFSNAPADLIASGVIAPIAQNDDNADYFVDGTLVYVDDITLSGSHLGTTLVFENAPEDLSALSYVLTKPAFRATNEDNVDPFFEIPRNGFSAAGAYVLGYTDRDLAQYGLDKPYSDCLIRIGDWRARITFGNPLDGYYPFIVEGSDVIYKIACDACEWVSFQPKDFYFDSLFLEYVSNIAEITVETEEKSVTFKLERENPDDGTDFDVVAVGYEDVTIDAQELCFYYGRVLALNEEEVASAGSPTDKPYMTLRFRYTKEGKKEDVISLYRYSTRRYLFHLNGEGNSLVAASIVQDLHDCLDVLLEGKEIGRVKYN